jgi:uncharacterized membrane protein HdeD (DUF308 family)
MNVSSLPRLNARYEECLSLHKCWAWFLALGIVLIAIGAAAIAYALTATLVTVLVFGIMLLASGVVQLVNAPLSRNWSGFFTHLLSAIVHLVVGGILVDRPLRGAEGLTLILAVAFLIAGGVRLLVALIQHFPGWNWVLLNGLITLFLGIAIWRQWPQASLWVIGTFVGIDLIFNGWSWVMLARAVKQITPNTHAMAHQHESVAAAAR